MTERLNDGEEDAWAELEYALLSDNAFAQQVNSANDELDMADLTAPPEHRGVVNDPYYLEDITDVADTLHDAFTLACQRDKIDIYAEEQDDELYDNVGQEIVFACYALKKQLYIADVVASDRGIYVEANQLANDYRAFVLEEGEKVVGRFASPMIARLPDEAYFLAGDTSRQPPAGVGLMIENPAVLLETGEIDMRFAENSVIVISLGTIGLRLEKFHFAINPDD